MKPIFSRSTRSTGIRAVYVHGAVTELTMAEVVSSLTTDCSMLDPEWSRPQHEAAIIAAFEDPLEVFDYLLQLLGARACTPSEAAVACRQWPMADLIAQADAGGLPWMALAVDGGRRPVVGVVALGIEDQPKPRMSKRPARLLKFE